MTSSHLKKTLVLLVKCGLSLGLLAYLLHQAQGDASFAELWDQPKRWGLLAAAAVMMLAAVLLTFYRWYLLVRALQVPFHLTDALRLGFLGYLLNFISLGSVGGDLFKAIFLAREQPGRRTEAVATVVVDRVVGLYCLLLLASAAALWGGLLAASQPVELRTISRVTLIATLLGGAGIGVALVPGMTGGRMSRVLGQAPLVGPTAIRLLAAVRIYRRKWPVMLVAVVLSLVVQGTFAVAIYLVGRGLPGDMPSLGRHFLIVPLSMVAGALPLPFAGLGAFEGALDFLYRYAAGAATVKAGRGLIVALCFRVITVLIALVGVVYYLVGRREVAATIRAADAVAFEPEGIEETEG
jgi:uncharacterized membrane protein YbhN (UPF0104 family)